MKTLSKVVVALALGAFGAAWSYLALIRLGWGRHGDFGWGFLHLDWILQPSLPYWGAHMGNLLRLAIGLACVFAALYKLYRLGCEWRASWKATRQAGAPETHEDAPDIP
jgi:hypothetical protein